MRFQDLFHSPPGVLFTFPSRYWFTIGRKEYLALEGGPPCFPQDSTCPAVLKVIARALTPFANRTITFFDGPIQEPSARRKVCNSVPDLDQTATPYNTLKA